VKLFAEAVPQFEEDFIRHIYILNRRRDHNPFLLVAGVKAPDEVMLQLETRHIVSSSQPYYEIDARFSKGMKAARGLMADYLSRDR
jgi:hypothetical protein